MRILLDTNIVLDIALEREPFCHTASKIFEASNSEDIQLFVTASTATDIYYILRKVRGRDAALAFLVDLLEIVDVCKVDKTILTAAINSEFPDFEDAVQNYAAIDSEMEVIVTRNKEDFTKSSVTVLMPDEFVKDYL